MTFFLNDVPTPAPRGPDAATSDMATGIGAAFRSAMLAGDNWLRTDSEKQKATQAVVKQAVQILGQDGVKQAMLAVPEYLRGYVDNAPKDRPWPLDVQKAIMDAAKADAVRNAGKWQGVDVGRHRQDGKRHVPDRERGERRSHRGHADQRGGHGGRVPRRRDRRDQ
jgi:hypothetical protein